MTQPTPGADPTGQPGTGAPPAADPPVDPPATGGTDGESDKWKALSRKHEAEAEKLRKEIEKLRAATMTESEKAISAAKTDGERAAAQRYASKLALSEFKSQATTAGLDVSDIADLFSAERYVKDDGEIDDDLIRSDVKRLAKRFVGSASSDGKGSGKTSGGAPRSGPDNLSGNGGGVPMSREQVESLAKTDPEQVSKLYAEGKLAHLM